MLKWLALILIALLIGLQIKLWVGDGGMRDLRAIRARVSAQQAENAKLKQRNDALHADVEDLKHGQDAVEARARSQLGLVKPGEVFYQVVTAPSGTSAAATPSGRTVVTPGSAASAASSTAPPQSAASAAPPSTH
ncbi:MAG: cell division protein FtsB [Rhodanobacteraceae bacterium]